MLETAFTYCLPGKSHVQIRGDRAFYLVIWPELIKIPCLYTYNLDYLHATDENDNYGEDQDSDMLEHHDHPSNGNKVDDNVVGGVENDEHTMNADLAMQCNSLPL